MHSSRIALLLVCLGLTAACQSSALVTRPKVQPRALRVMSYNIKHGRGMDGVVNLARAARVIRAVDPDVVALQEMDESCARSGSIDQAAWLGTQLGMQHAFGAFMDYDGGRYGMAILSKFPFAAVDNHELPPGTEPRTALTVRLSLEDGSELVLVGIHLYNTQAERMAQARRVSELFMDEGLPVILAGDFNSTPDSPVMQLLMSEWHNTDKGADRFTFDSRSPDREIDYILVRPSERFEGLRMDVLDEPMASDHRPVVLDLVYRPSGRVY